MKELLLRIFNSQTMYYVVVPLVIVFMEWVKNEYDAKIKNKNLGYWMVKFRKLNTFPDIAMKIYRKFALNLAFTYIVRVAICRWKGILFSYVVSGVLYFSIGILIVFLICRNAKVKVEFWTCGKCKGLLLLFLYLIYVVPFFIELYGKYILIIEVMFIVVLFIWMCCLYRYCDIAYILDNRYADIYIRGSEMAEFAEAGSIKKQGEWIIVNRYMKGYDEEIRIRESDIVRIDYYGGPMILLEKWRLIKR